MHRSRIRLLLLVLGLALMIVVSTLLYMWGMAALEGKPRNFWQSLEWAGETLSTTGYGADAGWRHPAMVLFVVAVQFIGVFIVFLIIPIYLIPFLEERFEVRLPSGRTRSSKATPSSSATARPSRPCSTSSPGSACLRWSWNLMRP